MRPNYKVRLISLASIFCVLAILLAACDISGNNNGTPNSIAAKQVLREASIGGDFDSLDPALTAGGLGEPINLLYTGLVATDDQGVIHDEMATSHQISPDGLTYTFTLHKDLKFSNGDKLDANDVAYSINRSIDPATNSNVSSYLSLLKDYDKFSGGQIKTLIGDSIIVKDTNTIALVLSKPAAYFLQALNYSTGDVVNKHLITKYGAKWVDHLQEGAGDGPFKVKSYSHTTGLVLVPNPTFYGFQPKLQEIDYTITIDRESTFKAMKAGQFDIAPVPPEQDAANKDQSTYQTSPALASRFIGMNYLVKPLDNIKIRQALDLAINKDLIIHNIIGTSVTPSNHIILNGIPGYNSNLTGPLGVAGTQGDLDKAKQLFAEGLKEEGYSSVSQLPGLTLIYDQSYKAGADTITAIVNEWKQELGFTVKLSGVQPNDMFNQWYGTAGNTSLAMWYGEWSADYQDPQDFTSFFFGKGAQLNGFNYGQNNSSDASAQQAVQDELAKADTTQNQATRLQMYQDAEQKLVNDVPYITIYQSTYSYLANPKLHGWHLDPLGSMATNDWANVYFTN